MVVVTLSDGTDEPDDRVVTLAREEAGGAGLVLVAYLGILDEPDAGILCHVFTAQHPGESPPKQGTGGM